MVTCQILLPTEHDMAEVVMLSVACREDGACITLCENTFTFTLDTTLLLAHSLAMNSVNSPALMQLELMYSSLFVGSEGGCSVLDDRLAMAFKKVHLPNSWSLYDNNGRFNSFYINVPYRVSEKKSTLFDDKERWVIQTLLKHNE